MRQLSLGHLPQDLLAHVLRFATGAARRDGCTSNAVPLSDWRYATVSAAFRRAFLENLASLSLDTPAAKRLAAADWQPLRACTSLRYIVICADAGLRDRDVVRLFQLLHSWGIPLRQADITVDRQVTQASVLCFAALFGEHVTHLNVRVPWVRRVRRRRLNLQLQNMHPNLFNFPNPIQNNAEFPPHADDDQAPQFALPPALNAGNLLNFAQGENENAAPPLINVFDGAQIVNAAANFEELGNLLGIDVQVQEPHVQLFPLGAMFQNQMQPEQIQPDQMLMQQLDINAPQAAQGNIPFQPQNVMNDPQPMIPADAGEPVGMDEAVEAVAAAQDAVQAAAAADAAAIADGVDPDVLPLWEANAANGMFGNNAPPNFPADFNDAQHLLNFVAVGEPEAPAVPPQPQPQPLGMPGMQGVSAVRGVLTNDVLKTALGRMRCLKELVLDRARHLTNSGILGITKLTRLEKLSLYGNHSITDAALKSVLARLGYLKSLRLKDMVLIGDGSIAAVCSSSSQSSLEFLELTRVGRVTDPVIKQLVNNCQKLRDVQIFDCALISCEAASHLSCSTQLRSLLFKPPARHPLMNRTTIHLSCASTELRSLQLLDCKNINLDGIIALGNLPGLRRLHLKGLGHVSQDVMRTLGTFPYVHDLTLQGGMNLTDLGVKVLCCQRGHRFLYLSLIDSTKNLTNEALDCISTWCVSLRTLEVHGTFDSASVGRVHETIPHAALRIDSSIGGLIVMNGTGGVWDPIIEDP